MPSVAEELAELRRQAVTKSKADKLKDADGFVTPEDAENAKRENEKQNRVAKKDAVDHLHAGVKALDQDMELRLEQIHNKQTDLSKKKEAEENLHSAKNADRNLEFSIQQGKDKRQDKDRKKEAAEILHTLNAPIEKEVEEPTPALENEEAEKVASESDGESPGETETTDDQAPSEDLPVEEHGKDEPETGDEKAVSEPISESPANTETTADETTTENVPIEEKGKEEPEEPTPAAETEKEDGKETSEPVSESLAETETEIVSACKVGTENLPVEEKGKDEPGMLAAVEVKEEDGKAVSEPVSESPAKTETTADAAAEEDLSVEESGKDEPESAEVKKSGDVVEEPFTTTEATVIAQDETPSEKDAISKESELENEVAQDEILSKKDVTSSEPELEKEASEPKIDGVQVEGEETPTEAGGSESQEAVKIESSTAQETEEEPLAESTEPTKVEESNMEEDTTENEGMTVSPKATTHDAASSTVPKTEKSKSPPTDGAPFPAPEPVATSGCCIFM